jgi:DnaJ homolog subfamily C member 7
VIFFQTDEEKAEAENMFKSVGEAYEVLSNQEKKARYDSGIDVEDLDNPHAGGGFGCGGCDSDDEECGGGGGQFHGGGRRGGGGMGGVDPNLLFQMFMQQQQQGGGGGFH